MREPIGLSVIRCCLLETEPSPLLVLGRGTVCRETLLHVTHFHVSAENLKHSYVRTLIPLFCFSFSL